MSLLVGFTSITFALVIGGTIGLIVGFYRGWTEKTIVAGFDIALAFPAVVLALLLITFLGQQLQNILLVIGILAIAPVGRLARANTLVYGQREFVLASRALGAKNQRIIWQEIFPNVLVPMAGLALLGMALAIVAEGSLAFLGLSVEGSTPTWGKMIVAGSSGTSLRTTPMSAFVPDHRDVPHRARVELHRRPVARALRGPRVRALELAARYSARNTRAGRMRVAAWAGPAATRFAITMATGTTSATTTSVSGGV